MRFWREINKGKNVQIMSLSKQLIDEVTFTILPLFWVIYPNNPIKNNNFFLIKKIINSKWCNKYLQKNK